MAAVGKEIASAAPQAEADAAFLKDIDRWRCDLARNIALGNTKLSQDELNAAVEQTIDLIVFLRISEDRGIDSGGLLEALASGTRRLAIDGKVVQEIIRPLGRPESPYELSALSDDILGQIYERSLGTVVRLTKDHQAVVEENPAVKKSGGVYYTPTYIVDYIVEKTVGELIRGKSPSEVSGRTKSGKPSGKPFGNARPLSVLDPACGSGSFLIRAYQFLLDWYLDAYVEDDPEKHQHRVARHRDGEWRLTMVERKRILIDHIFGVDIDPRAVEATKRSLLLKASEGSLPDLAANIRCGNSLIGPDFHDRLQVDPLDWNTAFAAIIHNGGFDTVIGNPPYGAELSAAERVYVRKTFDIGNTDTAALFMLKARQLLRLGGLCGFIVPKSFTYASNWRRVRTALLNELDCLVDVAKVWNNVRLEQVIYRLTKGSSASRYERGTRRGSKLLMLGEVEKRDCQSFGFLLNGIDPQELQIAKRLLSTQEFLGDVCSNIRGGPLQRHVENEGDGRCVIGGKQVQRYGVRGARGVLPASFAEIPPQSFVSPGAILVQNIVAHVMRPIGHIMIIGAIVPEQECRDLVILDTVNQLTCGDKVSPEYLLGLLHSRLINWFVYRFIFAGAIRTMHFDGPVSNRIPVRLPNAQDRGRRKSCARVADLVTEISQLTRRRNKLSGSNEIVAIDQVIHARSSEIDRAVYDIFDLSGEDVRLVEQGGL